MTPEPGELDVKTALATIDRAVSYTAPLQRRTEGIAWILFGLATAFFVFSYTWLADNGYDPTHRWLLLWFAGYAFLATGPALLTWRVASVVNEGYAIDGRRVAMSIVVLAVALVVLYYAIWIGLGENSDQEAVARLMLAFIFVLLGGAPWATLGAAQWTRMSRAGRRDTLVLGATMAVVGVAMVYLFRADLSTRNLGVVIFVATFGLIPLLAGLWRLAKT